MNASTPGPWDWDGKFTVTIPHRDGDTAFRTHPEDARLIVAAPDLLAACTAMVAWFDRLAEAQHRQLVLGQTLASATRNWETLDDGGFDLTPMRVAIAKATGGAVMRSH